MVKAYTYTDLTEDVEQLAFDDEAQEFTYDIDYWTNPKDKTCNAIIEYNGRATRLRAAMLIINKENQILLCKEKNEENFSLPGGGLEENETPIQGAKREAQEEVRINTKKVRLTDCDYCDEHNTVADWVKENIPEDKWWYNYYTCLCIGEYASPYTGKIDKIDQDPHMLKTATWYYIEDAVDLPTFKQEWKDALIKFGYYKDDFAEALLEDTRNVQIAKSRNAGPYKDQSRGKNRFERKKYSKVANTVKQFNTIDMNKFFKHDILELNIPVTGETKEYEVTIRLEGIVTEIAKNIKSNQNKLEFRTIIQALTKVFNTADIYTKCTCEDHRYRFAHWNIVNNVSVDDTAHDPGPGKGIANPNDDKGRGCKHVLLVLNNGDWMMKVASVINNYIHYAAENMQKPFLQVIFPKLYGVPAAEMVDQGIIDDEKFLDSSKGLIDAINEYGKNRGKYKAGTNKNPVTGTGGRPKKDIEIKK